MKKELVIGVNNDAIAIALLEDQKLVEIHKDTLKASFAVGNIYLGRVKRVMQGLNAAFVDIGSSKEAFIHYHDLGDQFLTMHNHIKQVLSNRKHLPDKLKRYPNLEREGNIKDVLTTGDYILVQIVKEPISTKGSRLSAEISLAGRNIVLLPFADKVSVSQKIASKEEKKRLEALVGSILPKNYGAIIRTAAEGKKAAVLVAEVRSLIEKWESSWARIAKSKGVGLLFTEYSKTTTVLRDLLNDEFSNVFVNDEKIFEETRQYVSLISPEQEKIVKLVWAHKIFCFLRYHSVFWRQKLRTYRRVKYIKKDLGK